MRLKKFVLIALVTVSGLSAICWGTAVNRASSFGQAGAGLYNKISIVGFSINLRVVEEATIANVSAASYSSAALAPEAIVAVFGSNLATSIVSASTTPLPTTLGGATVKVRDSAGTERLAPLFFVSATQVNYQMPQATATGAATVTITSGNGAISTGTAQIAAIAPGLFTAKASGQGVAATVALGVKADGTRSFEPIAQFDQSQNRFVAVPVDLGPESDQVFLLLFGTGIRFRSSLSTVRRASAALMRR